MDENDRQDTNNEEYQPFPEDPGEPPGQISKEKNTGNLLPNTDMEVHHHPQLDHKPKPWKEYLLEGLMIFIAVMMGFIAENIREGITNREHVRELVSQLVQDLKNDTIQLNNNYREEMEISRANDTLIDILQQPLKEENIGRLQQLIIRSHSLWLFYPSGGAMAAIKNEIHLKQFSSSKMIGLIAGYEKHIDLLHTVQDITLQYQRTYLDPFLLHHFTTASLYAGFNKIAGVKTQARNLLQEDLTQLGSDMVLVNINTQELLTNNRRLLADVTNLLKYVKEQFKLNNE